MASKYKELLRTLFRELAVFSFFNPATKFVAFDLILFKSRFIDIPFI
jgi:hypothetical protein